jgi:hypothetical protein
MKRRSPSIFVFLLLVPLACNRPQTFLPTTTMQIGSDKFVLEKAITPHDQEVGLMHRDSLDPGYGMIFINAHDQPQAFWNHDTHFDLQLLFIDSHSRIVDIEKLKKWDETTVRSTVPAQFIIELNPGTAERVGVKIGDTVTLPPDVQSDANRLASQ